MGGYSFADHMFALNCGLLAIFSAISTGVTILIVIVVLFVSAYLLLLAALGWFALQDWFSNKKKSKTLGTPCAKRKA